ncbi:MAG: SPOR domain-containing protein [Marinilabiliaceae bacterium]|nr:SPOR domain-containing protein [Marinilabiliaceae bacterium]
MRNLVLIYIFLLIGVGLSYGQNDLLAPLRTDKKIITVESETESYYAIQILAIQEPPQNPDYFKNIEVAKEFKCNDGFVRYIVGQYETFNDAAAELDIYKEKGYPDVFVVNTSKLGQVKSKSGGRLIIDPSKNYLIQLSAFRFPVYISYFEQFDKVLEFYMKDKIYRYSTPLISGSEVESELKRIKEMGYKGAFIVEYDKYQPYQIE